MTPQAARPRSGRVAERRERRAQRILDAAAELVLRWGYDKTTVDDVARAAGVAKGTIYLHWKSREELFVALLRRERAEMLAEVEAALTADPAAATLSGLLARLTLALLRRPLLKAALLREAEVIGKLVRAKYDDPDRASRSEFARYLGVLRDQGLVRTDLPLAAQLHLIGAATVGFLSAPTLIPGELWLPGEQAAELLAEAVDRALDRGRPLDPGETERLAAATMRFLGEMLSAARAKYHASLDTAAAKDEP
jgi:Transcriptional regulator